jgi:signal transduction histidine kinase
VSRRAGGRGLFWTIAGLFLGAIALGTLLQVVIAIAVLRPLEARESRARAEEVAAALAGQIAALPAPRGAGPVHRLLEAQHANLGRGPALLAYHDAAGWWVTDPPDRERFVDDVLAGRRSYRRGGADERGGAPPQGPGGDTPTPLRETIVRHEVGGPGGSGEVIVLRPQWRGMPPMLGSPTAWLFVPIALVLSVLVGLLMVRVLVPRLRAMEALAERVAEGDLSVRLGDASGDEIGRLARGLDRMTDRLAEARARVEEADQQRRQLFADITHELATPLTSIRGYAEIMLDPGIPVSDEERARYVRGVLEESRRLDRLIRDLFELARLEAGAAPLSLERLDWAALCRNTVERFTPRFRDAGLRLGWDEPAAPVWMDADGRRMEQVLENLLSNALRYVPSGGSVRVRLQPAARPGRALLAVADDGPGVPPDQLAHVFERFYRADATRPAGTDTIGSGLGLAIVHEIVARHGGVTRALASAPSGLTIEVEMPVIG